MTSRLLLLCLMCLISPAAWAAEFAVVRSPAPTTNGATQDFTSPAVGTPACAIFMVSGGTTNGTAANHALLGVGLFDGTRSYALSFASEDNVGPTDTGQSTGTSSVLLTLASSNQAVDGVATASSITNGYRLTWTDAPPVAYQVSALLIGGTGVSNCRVDNANTPSTVDTATNVTTVGFLSDVVFVLSQNEVTSSARASIGMAVRDGSDTQRSISFNDTNGNGTASISGMLNTSRVSNNPVAGLAGVSISGFDASGFDLFLRDTTGTAQTVGYLALQLNGLSAKLITSPSPTATGSRSITGVGFTPQVGIMLSGEYPTVNTLGTNDNAETYGLGFFTPTGSACASIYSEDGATTSNTESITNAKPICLRKDAALYMEADFTEFTDDGVTFFYGTAPSTATQRAVLFVESSSVSSLPPGIRRRMP